MDDVGPLVAGEDVVALAAVDLVVASFAEDHIVVLAAGQLVGDIAADQRIGAAAADHVFDVDDLDEAGVSTGRRANVEIDSQWGTDRRRVDGIFIRTTVDLGHDGWFVIAGHVRRWRHLGGGEHACDRLGDRQNFGSAAFSGGRDHEGLVRAQIHVVRGCVVRRLFDDDRLRSGGCRCC